VLAGDESHPTMEDVYQKIKSQMPDVSRSTIYNTLRELVEMGELNMVDNWGSTSTRYDLNASHHHHLYCVQCHKLIDIEEEIGSIEYPDEKETGFKIQRSQVTFFGLCSDCQK
jgi:Fe2+ or Zn2+ uptake regulation protein